MNWKHFYPIFTFAAFWCLPCLADDGDLTQGLWSSEISIWNRQVDPEPSLSPSDLSQPMPQPPATLRPADPADDVQPLSPERQRRIDEAASLDIDSIDNLRASLAIPPAYNRQNQRLRVPDDLSDALVESHGPGGTALPPTMTPEEFAVPADYCHQPLYFEEINLERYGNSHGLLQPAISGAKFFLTIPAIPYMLTVEKPWICYHPDLSYPPPGVFVPWQPEKTYPLRLDAAAVEAATVTGLIFLIP